ncbi:MAG TPA: hypothetical protein VNV42_01080 [Solirubrobacteraceae bacterium]|nr:hypothetical protein [Solirubrobacteraceae bacterium]
MPGADLSQFELITDRDGWSQIDDLRQARALVRPGPPPPTEEELDQLYEDIAEEPAKLTKPHGRFLREKKGVEGHIEYEKRRNRIKSVP